MGTKYIGFVEADAGIVIEVPDNEDPEEYFERVVNTGHLGPPEVRNVEKDE